jgi:general secretion pathway protein C
LFYKIASFPLVSSRPEVKIGARPDESLATQRDALPAYGVIVERNLFRTTLKAVADKQLDGGFFGSGQEYSAYDLKGTVAGDSSFGFAILEERGKNKQILCRLGNMVGSAKLIKITRNTVVLRTTERDITLKIKETAEGPLFSRPGAREIASQSGISLSRREVTEKLGDLKTIMNQALVRPFYADGVQEGFIISEIKPESLYQKLGLQNGDIIMDVNNKQMQSAEDVLQLVNLMQSGGQISLSLKRNGKVEIINYSFN